MALAKKCDRCGRLYEEHKKFNKITKKEQVCYLELNYMSLDLCASCEVSFFRWLKKKED